MAPISNTSSLPGLAKEPSQHAGAQSLLAATIGLMSLSAPTNPSNSPSEDQGATAMDQFSVSERIAAMNRAAVSRARAEAEALPSTPASLPRPPARDSIEPVISTKNFPETLLEVISSEHYQDVVSWLPHGRGFVILDKERFASEILPRYFDGAKFPSFTRRMKRWNFVRVPRGPEMGAYYHENFARDRPELVREMTYGAGGKFGEGKKKKQEGDKLKKEKMDTWHRVDPQEYPMPLPSTLPKNKPPKPCAAQTKMAIDAMGHHAKNAMEVATLRKNMEQLENQADSVWSSSFSPRPPRSETPLNLHKRGIKEAAQEFLLARSRLSQQVAKYRSSSRPVGAAGTRSMTEGRLSNHQPYHTPEMVDVQRMIENERAKRILDAEINERAKRILDAEMVMGHYNRQTMRNIMASEIQASSKVQSNAMDAVVRDLQSRLKPSLLPSLELLPLRSIGSGRTVAEALGGRRPIAMGRKEEEELLARYLALGKIDKPSYPPRTTVPMPTGVRLNNNRARMA